MYASSADLEVTDDGESSLYNGDENHKIWMGSHEQINGMNGHQNGESHYDFYSNGVSGTSTLGRPSRQRQIAAPIPVPPPPKEEIIKQQKKIKDNKKAKSVGSQSLSGTLIRPRPIHPMSRGPPPHMMYGPPPGHPHMMPPPHHMGPLQHPPNGMNGRQFHTIGHHRGHPPPQMMPMHMPPMQPILLPPQYATLQSLKNKNKKKGKDKMNGIPVPLPMPPMFYPPPSMAAGDSPRALGMSNRKLAQSTAALDDSGNSGAESPCGTGIYRRKGHLNERAFSYSIRQEHRSRSHGSLASLQFNPPDMKKEREIIQLVSDLELNDESTLRRNREMSSAGSSGTFGKPRR